MSKEAQEAERRLLREHPPNITLTPEEAEKIVEAGNDLIIYLDFPPKSAAASHKNALRGIRVWKSALAPLLRSPTTGKAT